MFSNGNAACLKRQISTVKDNARTDTKNEVDIEWPAQSVNEK
jgi:hypothetical protein